MVPKGDLRGEKFGEAATGAGGPTETMMQDQHALTEKEQQALRLPNNGHDSRSMAAQIVPDPQHPHKMGWQVCPLFGALITTEFVPTNLIAIRSSNPALALLVRPTPPKQCR
jgi:hypothetical protein